MRLIDADALHKALFAKQKWVVRYGDKHNEGYTSDQVHFAIDDAPTVDAVEVVRCKDCKWWKTNYLWNGNERKICAKEAYEPLRNAEDFCSHGERREDETD